MHLPEMNDKGMPELLRFENIAWYEDGAVRILDRRIYPEIRYEICRTPEEVALAIRNMVTQSGGPLLAVQMGMVLAAKAAAGKPEAEQIKELEGAAAMLGQARPTTSAALGKLAEKSLQAAKDALSKGTSAVDAVFADALEEANARYARIGKMAQYLVETFPASGIVMTQCFAETIVGKMCLETRNANKDIRFFCPETRPYLQGARLTASVISDLGFPVTVITDNMPAAIFRNESVDVFTSAADVITGDGHVINKVGTFQIALAARWFNVPYYVSGEISRTHATAESVTIEMRDPDDVLRFRGIRTTKPAVKGLYPAFDVTPPEFVTGIVTENGIVRPGH